MLNLSLQTQQTIMSFMKNNPLLFRPDITQAVPTMHDILALYQQWSAKHSLIPVPFGVLSAFLRSQGVIRQSFRLQNGTIKKAYVFKHRRNIENMAVIPQQIPCPNCQGTGFIWNNS